MEEKGVRIDSSKGTLLKEIEEIIIMTRKSTKILKGFDRKSTMFTALVGECLVLSELVKKGFNATWKGKYGFGRYDIEANGKKVEVKSATYNKKYRHWGFGNISPEKFQYLVCVALDEGFYNPRYFIFTNREATSLPTENEAHKGRTTRFSKGGKQTFHLFDREEEQFQPSEILREINRNIDDYEDHWDKILIDLTENQT